MFGPLPTPLIFNGIHLNYLSISLESVRAVQTCKTAS